MSSSLRRGALAASALAFSIASLAACGAGNNAQTLEIRPDNAETSVGAIKVQNALVITQPDAKANGPAAVAATLFNDGATDQTLQSIAVDGSDEKVQLKPAKGGKLVVPAHGRLVIGGKDNASAVLASGREAVQNGNAQKVTFTFSKTGAVGLRAFVVPATSYFSGWGPSEVPSAPASSSPAGSPSASESPAGDKPSSPASAPASSPSDSASASAGQ